MDKIEDLANATNVTYAEIFMELYIDSNVHSELFQRIYNESFFNKEIQRAFFSFQASFPEVKQMIAPVRYGDHVITPNKYMENDIVEYHYTNNTYYVIEKVVPSAEKEEDALFISKKYIFKRKIDAIELEDGIIDFSKDYSVAKNKLKESIINHSLKGNSKEKYMPFIIKDMKSIFPNDSIRPTSINQKIMAI